MIEHSSAAVMAELMRYIDAWQELDRQHSRIPSWRWIKQHRNITARIKLTKAYTAKMKAWGIL